MPVNLRDNQLLWNTVDQRNAVVAHKVVDLIKLVEGVDPSVVADEAVVSCKQTNACNLKLLIIVTNLMALREANARVDEDDVNFCFNGITINFVFLFSHYSFHKCFKVGFPGNIQHSNKAKQVATLQLASVILDLLNDQNQTENIAGGGGGGGGFLIGTGSGSGGGPMGGGGPRGGRSGGGNFQGGRGSGPQNMSGPGPMRNQGFKNERSAPYPSQNMNAGGPQGGGKFNQNRSGGMGGGGPGGNFGQNRGGNFNNSGDNGNWNNVSGGLGPRGGPNRSGGAGSGNFQNQGRVGGGGGFNDNFSSGFSGNMNNVPAGNFGGQQDRRGFTLPTNQPPKYGVAGNQQGSGFGGDLGFGNDDGLFQRRNHNGPNM